MKPEIIIDGTWLSSVMLWGDLEWVTCWPGGTESITFSVARDHRIFHRPDALVELDYGGIRLAAGALVEQPRGEPLMAEGLHRKAEDEPALSAAGEVAPTVYDAVDAAISRGLRWHLGPSGPDSPYDVSPVPWVDGVPNLDLDQPHSVAEYLDASAKRRGHLWGVDPYGYVTMTPWPTVPSMHMLPGLDGLAISRNGYASELTGRYLDVADNVYRTRTREDAVARKRWGRVPRIITEPLGEGAPMAAAAADQILDGLLAQGRSQIGWTAPIEVQFGDLVNEYQQPIDLNRIRAGQVDRLHGLDHDIADLAGGTTFDMRLARTRHKGSVVIIEPLGLVSPMNDALAGVNA